MNSVGIKIITTPNKNKKNLWDQYTDVIRKINK